jgi:hypothetical protein
MRRRGASAVRWHPQYAGMEMKTEYGGSEPRAMVIDGQQSIARLCPMSILYITPENSTRYTLGGNAKEP